MTKKLILTIIISAALTSGALAGSKPNLTEGMWEITTRVEMPGMPVDVPPTTHTQCMTKEDFVPRGGQQSNECRIFDTGYSSDTVSWKIECKSGGAVTRGSGSITYSGDHFDGTMTVTVPEGNMQIKNYLKGRRIGPCK